MRGLSESEIDVTHVLAKHEKSLSAAHSSAHAASVKLERIIKDARERRRDKELERLQLEQNQLRAELARAHLREGHEKGIPQVQAPDSSALAKQTVYIETALLRAREVKKDDDKNKH